MRITSVSIEWFDQIKDCFFTDGSNWHPGWALAKIDLPFAHWKHTLYLVRDFSGIAYWKLAVEFRESSPQLFNRHPNLDWHKIYHFDALPEK